MKSNRFYENTFVLFGAGYSESEAERTIQSGARVQPNKCQDASRSADAPSQINHLVAALLMEDWSQLHAKASPRQIDLVVKLRH